MRVVKTIEEAKEIILDYCGMVGGEVGFDFETDGLNPHDSKTLLLSLAHTKLNTTVLDLTVLPDEIWGHLRQLFENENITKIAHNATFEYKFLYHKGIKAKNIVCTKITDQLLYAGVEFDFTLAAAAKRHLGIVVEKDVRDTFFQGMQEFTDEQYAYSAYDSEILLPLFTAQKERIISLDLIEVFQLECHLIPATAKMEYFGILVDQQRLQSSIPKVKTIVDDMDEWLQKYIIEKGLADVILFDRDGIRATNTSSPSQMLDVLQKNGIEVESMSKKELSDWDSTWSRAHKKEEKDNYLVGYNHPLLRHYGVKVAASKLLSTYYEGLLNLVNVTTGKIHPTFNQCGASATGRYSSSSPNFQNIPQNGKIKALGLGEEDDIRSAFTATPGWKFLICDYSGIELVILGAFSGDKNLIARQLEGDLHSYVARRLFSVKEEDWDKKEEPYKTMRNIAKTITYAIMYGTTALNLYRTAAGQLSALGINIKSETAEEWLQIWKHELFPDTGKFLEESANSAVTKLYTTSVMGRRRFWSPDIRRDHWKMLAAQREGSNQRIQSSSADMTKLAMVMLDKELHDDESRIVATIHDELLVEVREDKVEDVMVITKNTMEGAGRHLFPHLDPRMIVVEPKVSDRYDK